MYWPTVAVFNGARYVLDYEDGPATLDAASKAVPVKGLVLTPLIEGPIDHQVNGMAPEGHVTRLLGDTKDIAVAVVASQFSIIIQDAYLWRGGRWPLRA